jgi:hypothetical protein
MSNPEGMPNPATANATPQIENAIDQVATSKCVGRILISPTPARAGRFDARLPSGQMLVVGSRQPFLDGARVLLKSGWNPQQVIVMRHVGSSFDSLKSTVGAAAKLTVDETNRPTFARWKAFPSTAEQRHSARSDIGASEVPPSDRSNQGAGRRHGNTKR